MFFGARQHYAEQVGEHREVVVVLDAGGQRTGLPIQGALGLALVMGFGVMGFVAFRRLQKLGSDKVATRVQNKVRVGILSTEGGTRLTFASQVDTAPPQPLSVSQLAEMRDRLIESRSMLRSYYVNLAVWGPRATGAPAMQATRPALERRLTTLGFPAVALDRCVRLLLA